MNQHNKPPLTIFGIPARAILIVLVFLIVLLSLFNPLHLKQSLERFLNTNGQQEGSTTTPSSDSPDRELIVTPEMISEAAREVQAERIKKFESRQEAPVKVNYYLITLIDGGSIEAESISIRPDQVTVITEQGVESVIPRENIKKIIRLQLDPKPTPGQK